MSAISVAGRVSSVSLSRPSLKALTLASARPKYEVLQEYVHTLIVQLATSTVALDALLDTFNK